jgi:ABC-type dipeptide/oligopeptide/nickel transport system ATPase component
VLGVYEEAMSDGEDARDKENMSTAQNILTVCDLTVLYQSIPAVQGVSLEVGSGEIVGIVGESGSGKSTLLRAVAHLLAPTAHIEKGSIAFAEQDITHVRARKMRSLRGASISYLFQNAERSFDPLFTIGAQFDEVMRAHTRSGRLDRAALRTHQHSALCRMGFRDPERVLVSYPFELSGGMCQRVALAFALAGSPQLLLADEPTSSLDRDAQARVIDLLRTLNTQENLAILVVSHDIDLLARFAHRIIVMHEGRIVEAGTSAQIMNDPQDPYTQALIEAIPRVCGEMHIEQLGGSHAS